MKVYEHIILIRFLDHLAGMCLCCLVTLGDRTDRSRRMYCNDYSRLLRLPFYMFVEYVNYKLLIINPNIFIF